MPWNWELPNWPKFTYASSKIRDFERQFFQRAGEHLAVLKYVDIKERNTFIVESLCVEGLKSAEIEGEILERQSLQSSIQRHFGLSSDQKGVHPKEQGMADLMCCVYDTFAKPLTHEMLYQWHEMLIPENTGIVDRGTYRTHDDPMQIISGRYDKHTIFFEAPPSHSLKKEMTAFIQWFNKKDPEEPILGKASIAHLYFESIHPFEDGNGRIGRALVEKLLSQSLEQPTLLAISRRIQKMRKDYYAALGRCNRSLEANSWVTFFSQIILDAQEESAHMVRFILAKSKLMDRLSGKINQRQEKVLLRIFEEGVDGFKGGVSAENYIAITKTSRATATRDLADLVEKGAFRRTGERKHTRYWLEKGSSFI